eukprot:scaffold2224_cov261-Pinguiococcus_pyrenoidosus.AAC.13
MVSTTTCASKPWRKLRTVSCGTSPTAETKVTIHRKPPSFPCRVRVTATRPTPGSTCGSERSIPGARLRESSSAWRMSSALTSCGKPRVEYDRTSSTNTPEISCPALALVVTI